MKLNQKKILKNMPKGEIKTELNAELNQRWVINWPSYYATEPRIETFKYAETIVQGISVESKVLQSHFAVLITGSDSRIWWGCTFWEKPQNAVVSLAGGWHRNKDLGLLCSSFIFVVKPSLFSSISWTSLCNSLSFFSLSTRLIFSRCSHRLSSAFMMI